MRTKMKNIMFTTLTLCCGSPKITPTFPFLPWVLRFICTPGSTWDEVKWSSLTDILGLLFSFLNRSV